MSPAQPGDSLAKRYAFKLSSNLATIPLFFILESILPRALGPATYGSYSFATLVFTQIITFLESGSSTCLATLLSKRQKEFGLVAFYTRMAVLLLLVTVVIAFSLRYYLPLGQSVLPNTPLWLIIPAAIWAYLTWLSALIRRINDTLGLTVRSEVVRMAVNVVSAALLLILYFSGVLDVVLIFVHQYTTFVCLSIAFSLMLRGAWPEVSWRMDSVLLRRYAHEFWEYSAPLFVMGLFTAIAISGERWLLQYYAGSTGQGYFALAQKIGIGCFLCITAMVPLLTRELAVAHGKSDKKEMGRLIDRFTSLLYAVAAWFACFCCIEAENVLRIFGGAGFGEALIPVKIMVFYALHQTYIQIGTSVFYASGMTKPLSRIMLAHLAAGLATSYVMLAPYSGFGLQLGATGMALKMVGVQFVFANIFLIASLRIVSFAVRRLLIHQFICPAAFLGLAWLCRQSTLFAIVDIPLHLPRFLVSGMLYTLLTIILVVFIPAVVGISRQDLQHYFRILQKSIRKKTITGQ